MATQENSYPLAPPMSLAAAESRHSVAFRGVARYLLWVAAVLVTINLVIWPILMIVLIAVLSARTNS